MNKVDAYKILENSLKHLELLEKDVHDLKEIIIHLEHELELNESSDSKIK